MPSENGSELSGVTTPSRLLHQLTRNLLVSIEFYAQ